MANDNICENCKYRGTLSIDYPCCDCLVRESGSDVTFTKFSPIDATCIPKHNDKIHRYLDKLKEAGLITHYRINTVYMDDKPYCTNISWYKDEYVYSRSFNDLNDENLVIEIIADCVIKFYRGMANYLMEEIKNDKC